MENDESNQIYLPFDQYMYRKVIEQINEFLKVYRKLYDNIRNQSETLRKARQCSAIAEILMDFTADCQDLPVDIRNPSVEDWDMYMGRGTYILADPNKVAEWVMKLFNEIKRQQTEKKMKLGHITTELGIDE